MTSLEKYKSAIEKAKEIKETDVFADLESTSRENFENAYNRALSVVTKAEAMPEGTLDELSGNLLDSINFLAKKADGSSPLFKQVVVAGIDGMGNYDRFASTPFFDALRKNKNALYTDTALSVLPTISAENWCAMLKGVGPEKHGYNNEKLSVTPAPDNSDHPSVFKYLRDKYPFAQLCSFVNWEPINFGGIEHNIGVEKFRNDDNPLADQVIEKLVSSRPLFTFIAFDGVDEAGHHGGYGSEEHLSAIMSAEQNCRRIYEAIEQSGRMDDTLFIILTDHGGIGHGHGGNDDKERLNSYIAVGKGLKSGKLESEDFHTATMAAVVLRALGVSQSDSYDFPVPECYFA
mgnify:FL=1